LLATEAFVEWQLHLRDLQAQARITVRLGRLANGNPGDCSSVGGGVQELRIHHGAGYRVYFARVGSRVLVLLAGGDKQTQAADIRRAQELLLIAQREYDA
jgi:putative addiction module killer protein